MEVRGERRVAVGSTISLTACATYSDGTESCGVEATWRSDRPGVATVDSRGRVTGVAAGEAQISATFEGRTGSLVVTVDAVRRLTGVEVRGDRRVTVGRTISLTACATYSDGTESCGVQATWRSDRPGVATVDSRGRVTGVAAGEAQISATFEGRTGSLAVTVEGASAGAQWRGLRIVPENRCSPYDAGDYSYPQSVEDDIVRKLGGIYSPYTCEEFTSTRETDIEHIVARSEAHDSGLCAADDATRRRFARDLINLTLASPGLNRGEKGARDAAEWAPEQNRCWFAHTVIEVRRAYGLTVDRREADALDRLLAGCSSTAISCRNPREADPPPIQRFRNCDAMRTAGWRRGVNRNGGTYRVSWDDAERQTYQLNTARDGDKDGHACE